MTRSIPSSHDTRQNRLLSSLCADIKNRLFPHIELVYLPFGKVLYESGSELRHIYFPIDAIVSLLLDLESGTSMEIAVVGNDGLVGYSLFMGGEGPPSRAVVHSAGTASRLPASRLSDEISRHDELLTRMLRYTQSLITQMAQIAVCNRHHTIEQQLCRRLLLSLDRLYGNELTMTQELIANLLGVRREGITEAAGKLQKAGIIEYSRGKIRVLDRARLEQLSCECYRTISAESDRLVPEVARVNLR